MAGDWLKMTHALPEKPEVLEIAGRTSLSRFDVVGRLFILWRWFDTNTVDGNARGVTKVTLNACLFGDGDVTNFVSAVIDARWLTVSDDGISVVKFDSHISESAKTRGQTAKRVAKSKANAGNAEGNGKSVTKTVPREEKRREDIKPPSEVRRATKKCPTDFEITEDMRTWAALECPTVDVAKATAAFRDYTFKTSRSDWPATWRNWLRKDAEFNAPGAGTQAEPAWRKEQRERTQKAAPGVAVGGANQFFEAEAKNVTPIRIE